MDSGHPSIVLPDEIQHMVYQAISLISLISLFFGKYFCRDFFHYGKQVSSADGNQDTMLVVESDISFMQRLEKLYHKIPSLYR